MLTDDNHRWVKPISDYLLIQLAKILRITRQFWQDKKNMIFSMMSVLLVPYCPPYVSDNGRVWQNHFSPGSHFWPDELPFQMKNCNATLIALHSDPRKKFHFPVEAIKSTEVAEHKWGSHNSNFQFFEVELQLLCRWWILLKRFPIHFSYIFNNFSSTFDVDKKWIIRIFFSLQVASCDVI